MEQISFYFLNASNTQFLLVTEQVKRSGVEQVQRSGVEQVETLSKAS